MSTFELQKAVGAYNDWLTVTAFSAENLDEAERLASEYISAQRFYFGERKIRIIEVGYEGNIYGLSYPVKEDDKYTEFKGKQLAAEAEMYLKIQEEENSS